MPQRTQRSTSYLPAGRRTLWSPSSSSISRDARRRSVRRTGKCSDPTATVSDSVAGGSPSACGPTRSSQPRTSASEHSEGQPYVLDDTGSFI